MDLEDTIKDKNLESVAGLELAALLPQPPRGLESQACTTTPAVTTSEAGLVSLESGMHPAQHRAPAVQFVSTKSQAICASPTGRADNYIVMQ